MPKINKYCKVKISTDLTVFKILVYYICVLSFRLDKLGMNIPRFDFRCAGVTSVSADLHKFGYTPKVVYNFYQLLKLTTCILTTTELPVLTAILNTCRVVTPQTAAYGKATPHVLRRLAFYKDQIFVETVLGL